MKKKILVIEDHTPIMAVLVRALERTGYEVAQASTGDGALKVALKEKPDLILLDIGLPGIDGIDMMKKLRKDSWGAKVKVIILSNYSDEGTKRRASKINYIDFLIKTNIRIEEVIKKIANVLQ